MKRSEIIEILNYPDAALVDYLIARANLTKPEREMILLREIEGLTIEAAAERLDISETTVKRRYAAAVYKINCCWSGLPWVQMLRKQQK